MKSLKEYSIAIKDANPGELVSILQEMTQDYAEVCDALLPVERKKMDFWLDHKQLESEKPVSDKTLEMLWMRDGDGILEKRMEMYKRALEKLMSNLKSIIREKENEAKNQW